MSASTAFWVTYGAAGIAGLIALLGDMTRNSRPASLLAALLLGSAGAVAGYAAWSLTLVPVLSAFRAGGVYSAIPSVALLMSAAAVVGSDRLKRPGQAAALISFAATGACLAAVSVDLLTMLIGIEVAAVCAYALVSGAGTRQGGEAALKYFIQGSVATGLFVLGLAALVGTFAVDATLKAIAAGIGARPEFPLVAVVGTIALVSAVAFKTGAAPFHSWAPDAYESAPAPSAAFMAGALKLAMVGVLAAIVTPLASAGATAKNPYGVLLFDMFAVIGILAALSIVVGSTVALTTKSFRRMLGYAGVAQVGYAFIAMGALNPSSALVFTATYAVATTAAFLSAEAFSRIDPTWDGSIAGLAGMGRRSPVIASSLTLALLSLAGIPPLLGFWGKLQAFGSAIGAASGFASRGASTFAVWLGVLAGVGIIGTIVSLAYYGNVVRTLFLNPQITPSQTTAAEGAAGRAGSAGIAVVTLAFLLVALGVLPLIIGISASVAGFLLQ
ncbi:MAG TPA: proton-conducting transporter membrane subunit [Coriobacteriia bacterium]|nr:proton-conducting transporter membrane subunit [Coriobacteriia bacterium]